MKKLIIGFLLTCSIITYGQQNQNKSVTLLKNSNFYFLDQLTKQQQIVDVLNKSKVFEDLKTQKITQITSFVNAKPFAELQDIIGAYLFTSNEIDAISKEFIVLRKQNKVIETFFATLKKSKKYINYQAASDEQFVSKVVQLNLEGINHTLKVYGLGEKPFYPNIDSISYDKNSLYFKGAALFWAKHLTVENEYKKNSFFEPMLDYALYLMYMNHRDEAIRYEPLALQYNQKAIAYLKTVDFKKYEYNALIVLGDGPENYRDPLGALGKLNLKIAVEQYKQKKAPFIIVSGGHVHPNRTQTCEAIEMKKELMSIYAIPEEAIIIEPYARHTTTNLRNATRLMLDYGFDIKQKSMIVSYELHIDSIADKKFGERFLRELGYLPGEITRQKPGGLLDFYPSELMLQVNPLEPLDP
ncbi:MAG: YdcF family protein [Flavobacteriaceae bacterium]|jgi:hypothetical protein|nr:YdcF family protein [Flavobacteriaceae bacterium]